MLICSQWVWFRFFCGEHIASGANLLWHCNIRRDRKGCIGDFLSDNRSSNVPIIIFIRWLWSQHLVLLAAQWASSLDSPSSVGSRLSTMLWSSSSHWERTEMMSSGWARASLITTFLKSFNYVGWILFIEFICFNLPNFKVTSWRLKNEV